MLSKLRAKLRRWLGIAAIADDLIWTTGQTVALRQDLNSQIRMVGIDYGLKHDQTVIIFVSRLGREGGTVQIKPAYFKSVGELMDFIKFVDRSFDPNKVAIDLPYGMGRIVDEERKRGR